MHSLLTFQYRVLFFTGTKRMEARVTSVTMLSVILLDKTNRVSARLEKLRSLLVITRMYIMWVVESAEFGYLLAIRVYTCMSRV
jgi:uncharacterized membrane protein YqjE